MYAYMCMYVCMYVYICVYIHICIYVYMYICICIYIYIYIYIYLFPFQAPEPGGQYPPQYDQSYGKGRALSTAKETQTQRPFLSENKQKKKTT